MLSFVPPVSEPGGVSQRRLPRRAPRQSIAVPPCEDVQEHV